MIPGLSVEILAYIIAGLAILLVFLIINIIKLNNRLSSVLRGKNGSDLEETLKTTVSDIEKSLKQQSEINNSIKIIGENLKDVVSGVGVIRFNPFEGSSGSNQSFSVALINKKGDGVVFSSIYSRERVSVFAKPVDKFNSTYSLTEEETKALGKARGL
ncbi:DUF4446 family protein [Candidatus Parcubacteria bacterium]|nr:DUF4446 family protein [Candidatus Parcubacteria bacterium]